MKSDIHPTYYPKAKVSCACGHSFEVGSTKEEIHVEICSACHPFYTGEEKVIDTAGRVEKFKSRRTIAEDKQTIMKEREVRRKEKEKEKKKKEAAKKQKTAKK